MAHPAIWTGICLKWVGSLDMAPAEQGLLAGGFCSLGDIWQCLEAVLTDTTGRGGWHMAPGI